MIIKNNTSSNANGVTCSKLSIGDEAPFLLGFTTHGITLTDDNEDPVIQTTPICACCGKTMAIDEEELKMSLDAAMKATRILEAIKTSGCFLKTHPSFASYFDDLMEDAGFYKFKKDEDEDKHEDDESVHS